MDTSIKQNYRHVYVMGLGWLGLALAQNLLALNISVSGTVTSKEKQNALGLIDLNADLFNLYDNAVSDVSNNISMRSDIAETVLILNIPPGRKNFDSILFVDAMCKLIDHLMLKGLAKIIFISSTSVFSAIPSSTSLQTFNNSSVAKPITESGKAHLAIERHLQRHYTHRSAVLRLAGLIGPNQDASLRHPIYTLCNKQGIAKGNDVVNLVHQADVIAAIKRLLSLSGHPHSMNLAAIEHPTRAQYYTWCAQKLKLPMPSFAAHNEKRQQGKLIDAQQSFISLGIKPIYPSPYDMLV